MQQMCMLKVPRPYVVGPARSTEPAPCGGFFCARRPAMTRSDYLAVIIPIIPSLLLALARLSAELRCWLRGR